MWRFEARQVVVYVYVLIYAIVQGFVNSAIMYV